MKPFACLMTLASFATFGLLRADEEKVPLDKVPKAVMEAAKKRFPKGEVTGASKETENGKTEYEITVKDGGKKIDATFTPEGALLGLEKEIDYKDLPKAVKDVLEAKYPKAKYKICEEVIKVKDGKENLEYYEVLLESADKKTVEVVVTADGKITKTEEKKEEF